jgi:hypothetical protein
MMNSQSSARGWREALPVSRLHGAASGSGGPPGNRNGQYRHGERTKAAMAEQRKFGALLKMLRRRKLSNNGWPPSKKRNSVRQKQLILKQN